MVRSRGGNTSGSATVRAFAATVIQLMGVWVLVEASLSFAMSVPSLPEVFSASYRRTAGLWLGGYLLGTSAQVAIGVFLLVRAGRIANRIAGHRPAPALRVATVDLRSTAFALLALYLAYDAIASVADLVFTLADQGSYGASSLAESAHQGAVWRKVLTVAARLAFAAWLWRRAAVPGPPEDEGEAGPADEAGTVESPGV